MNNKTNSNTPTCSNNNYNDVPQRSDACSTSPNVNFPSDGQPRNLAPPTPTNFNVRTEDDQFSVEKMIEKHGDEDNNKHLELLVSLGVGLSDRDLQKTKCNELIAKRAILPGKSKPKQSYMIRECFRRYYHINLKEVRMNLPPQQQTKKPMCGHWKNDKLISWLKTNPPREHDRQVIISKLNNHLTKIEKVQLSKEEEKKINRMGLTKSNLKKMRFCHTVFLEELKRDLVTLCDTKSRPHHDARNSDQCPKDFYQKVCDKYNNGKWVPSSISIPYVPGLGNSVDLHLVTEDDGLPHQYRYDQVKDEFTKLKSAMNVAFKNWGGSGNGEGMLADAQKADGPEKVYRFGGFSYSRTDNEVEKEVEYLDDDRYNFVNGQMIVYYFWVLADLNEVVLEVSSSICAIGFRMDQTAAKTSGKTMITKVNEKKRKKNDRSDEMLSQIREMHNTFIQSIMQRDNQTRVALLKNDRDSLWEKIQQLNTHLLSLVNSESSAIMSNNAASITWIQKQKDITQGQLGEFQKEYEKLEVSIKKEEAKTARDSFVNPLSNIFLDDDDDDESCEGQKKRPRQYVQRKKDNKKKSDTSRKPIEIHTSDSDSDSNSSSSSNGVFDIEKGVSDKVISSCLEKNDDSDDGSSLGEPSFAKLLGWNKCGLEKMWTDAGSHQRHQSKPKLVCSR